MKKINWFLILILVLNLVSCGTQPVKVEIVKTGEIEKLKFFFQRSESDSVNAGNVLEKHKIIQHLTHLRKMNAGGKKFYLLEKDDITEMINSVTEGIYLDYILINKSGDIVYTKNNDELFGLNITNGYEASPIKKCFLNRTGVYFEDVSFIVPSSRVYSLYISSPIYVAGNFHGVLILQVEIKKISEILDAGTEICSSDGIIRVSPVEGRIFSQYSGFDKIDMKILESSGSFTTDNSDEKLKFYKFNNKEINWILINKKGL